MKRCLFGVATALVCGGAIAQATSTSSGQGYPAKPIEFVVPGNPGAGADIVARLVADLIRKEKLVAQPIVITNNGGGGILTVFGDNLDNTVQVSRDAAGKILVNGGAVPVLGGHAARRAALYTARGRFSAGGGAGGDDRLKWPGVRYRGMTGSAPTSTSPC